MPNLTVVELRPLAAGQAEVPPCMKSDADPTMWTPRVETVEGAAAACAGCPAAAKAACLAEAERLGAIAGYWGGLPSAARRTPKRKRGRAAIDAVRDVDNYVDMCDGRVLTARGGWKAAA